MSKEKNLAVIVIIAILLIAPIAYVGFTLFYHGSDSDGNWTIAPAPDLVYDGTPKKLVIFESEEDTIQYSTDGKNYSATVPTGIDAKDYVVFYKISEGEKVLKEDKFTVTIAPMPIIVRANDCSKINGQPDPEFTADVTETVDGQKIEYKLARESGEGFGSYAITPTGEKYQGNYIVTYEKGFLIIYNDIVVITPNDVSKKFGNKDPVFTATVTGATGISYTLSRDPGESMGTYKIRVSAERIQGEYLVEFETGILTIMETSSEWITKPTGLSYVFDGHEKPLVTPGKGSGGEVLYRLSTGEYSSKIPTASEPGIYTIYS